MPFLRNKRGTPASESELRRSALDPDQAQDPKEPPLRSTTSNIDLPQLQLLRFDSNTSADADAAPANGSTPAIPAPPVTPPHDSPSTSAAENALSVPVRDPIERPDSPPIQDETPKHRRFSMLRFRNASDSQLSARAKKQGHVDESAPPVPRPPPEIITTAPTVEFGTVPRKPSRMFGRLRRSGEEMRFDQQQQLLQQQQQQQQQPQQTQQRPSTQGLSKKDRRKSFLPGATSNGKTSISIEEPKRPKSSNAPSTNGSGQHPPLPLPGTRLSESSRSEDSSDRLRGNTAPNTQNTSNTTNFFRLPRRKPKQPEPLFPIAHLQKNRSHEHNVSSNPSLAPSTPVRASTSSAASGFGPQQTPVARSSNGGNGVTTPPGPSPARALFQKSHASPATALFRPRSTNSGASSPTRSNVNLRGRSSTMSSLGRESVDERLAPSFPRASTSTGRKSFGDLLGISRLRNNPESLRQGTGTPATPGSNTSKDNSLNIQRESVVLPERREDENPGRYLERLEEVASRSVIAAAISKSSDAFSLAVLRSYMRRFGFFGDPMDMAIRKLLMSAELPKETQHIDRFLQAFANRYHECNPGIYANPDQAYFIAFSILILHTDVFNKNNKHKMQKPDYIKNTKGEGIFDEVLEVFYDNITYTPFIHVEDDLDINGDRVTTHKVSKKKSILPNANAPDAASKRAAKEPIDPYTIILDNRLDILRPNLKDVMHLDDHFSYLGTAQSLNLKELQRTFFRTGILQIVSARSRPDAFMTEKTATNPQEAQPGVVDIKVTKVGLLWRKDVKKKKTRSPWQEWGAILTGAQLYFFRNTAWVKNLMHQYESHVKQGHDAMPIIFKPPLETFKPDALMSTDGAVSLLDATYKKHKHAFVYVRQGGLEEVLLADNEEEMNDWLAKLNYAAAFKTNGVRMRGVLGSNYDGQGRRAFRRLDTEAVQTPTGEVTIARSKVDQQMAQDILFARREIIFHKVAEANEKLQHEEKKLEQALRNARHLQLLAPVQPKTRDQMLMAAGRMAAQLKWTRVEICKLKCHRDILLMDLEEERQMLGLPPGPMSEAISPEKPALGREISKTSSGTVMPSPLTPKPTDAQRSQAEGVGSDTESGQGEAFQTPPRSAAGSSFHKHQNSWELPALNFDRASRRKASVSSAVSSHPSVPSTPPRTAIATSSTTEDAAAPADGGDHHEPDARERELLEQAGLLGADVTRSPEPIESRVIDPDATPDRQEHTSHSSSMDKADKNKIRRSLQRTLREGAGHLSHARSRKGKEPATSGSMDDNESEMLTRGSGSFVVHGKKASVITFGSELQSSLSPDERLRARKTSHAEGSVAHSDSAEAMDVAAGSGSGSGSGDGDFRVFLLSGPKSASKHRSSAASASTATARSFRDLHRKYSSAQAAKASSSGGNLTVPSDGESDPALSFSDGRRSPLLPEHVEELKEVEEHSDREENADGEDSEFKSATMNKTRETLFFTPEPPASPTADQGSVKEGSGGEQNDAEESGQGGASPTVPVLA
ncbi:protein transport protein sec73 [Diaporthe amygdali]|uniref:protein transport protein sec73 n=1 Tax=Phomopsis amygdali TaxID=1214568 RepID=UPI0022FEC56D|nr:protein transport protein sec73 [Diaporthe amygdali]KAJ0117664.1 protein transport protein sec73 [Diaporthe amygdali]